jgi:uncharacterized protein
VLEDTDPYRDCHQRPAADRLTDTEVADWQQHFAAAWQEINRNFPAYAPAIRVGLLMPMSPAPPGRDVSAAARQAFAAIGIALPADATTLALLNHAGTPRIVRGGSSRVNGASHRAARDVPLACRGPWRPLPPLRA